MVIKNKQSSTRINSILIHRHLMQIKSQLEKISNPKCMQCMSIARTKVKTFWLNCKTFWETSKKKEKVQMKSKRKQRKELICLVNNLLISREASLIIVHNRESLSMHPSHRVIHKDSLKIDTQGIHRTLKTYLEVDLECQRVKALRNQVNQGRGHPMKGQDLARPCSRQANLQIKISCKYLCKLICL